MSTDSSLDSPSGSNLSGSNLNEATDSAQGKRTRRFTRFLGIARASRPRSVRTNPLLNISIGKRLALGFLIPALIAAFTLSGVGVQSQQRLLQESIYYQNLFDAYTNLTNGVDLLQQMQNGVQQTEDYAANPQALAPILTQDETDLDGLATHFTTILDRYQQQDLLNQHVALVALFTEAGHASQIDEQATYTQEVQASWQAYAAIQEQELALISVGNVAKAQALSVIEGNSAYSDARRDLQTLIAFNETLLPSLHDAAAIQVQKLLLSTLFAVLGVLLGIGLVGWLISSTLVKRLKHLRAAAQAIASGQVDTRLDAQGRDEISDVSVATNAMVDTLVGLLEETRQQRDELAKGEELKCLHEALQQEQAALKDANSRLEHLSTTDMLTNLPNHRALHQQLEAECERARRFGHPLSLLFFDGDRFKQVNDTHGHATGDAVLRELGARARSVLRAGDTVGRFGGEEFMVLLPETDAQAACVVAERLRSTVAASPLATQSVEGGIAVTVSIGVATFPIDGHTGSEVHEQADQAMYWAKRLGRNQVRTAAEAVRANMNRALKASTAGQLERQELPALDGRDLEGQRRTEQLALFYSLTGVLDMREQGMSEHAHAVSDLVAGMARILQLDKALTMRAVTAAFLHDIGKIALPERFLEQPRQLFSEQEWQLLHRHAELGADIMEASPWLSDLAPAIRHHHKHWDGTGNADGLAGEAIPLEARLIAIAEAYHTMISERPYQASRSASEALEELERCSSAQFDPALLLAFRTVLAEREQESNEVDETHRVLEVELIS